MGAKSYPARNDAVRHALYRAWREKKVVHVWRNGPKFYVREDGTEVPMNAVLHFVANGNADTWDEIEVED